MRVTSKETVQLVAAAWALAFFAGSAEAQSVTYENTARKIIAERCLGCHGKGAPTLDEFEKDKAGWTKKMKGPRLDNYADLTILVNGTDAGAFMRRLDDGKNAKDGKPGNMYKNLAGSDAERSARLEALKKWVGNWSLKRRNELTADELKAITAPEK